MLHKINIFSKYFALCCIRNYCERLDFEENWFSNINTICDIFVYQPITSAHFNNTEKILDGIDDRIFKISLPYTYCNWMWLFGADTPDSLKSIREYAENNSLNHDTMSDKVANDVLANNIIDFDIFKRMQSSLSILKEKEQITQIKTHDFILENYKKRRLFFTPNHLAPPLIKHTLKEFCKIIKASVEINDDLDLGVYNSFIFYPISDYIKNLLGLEYEADPIGSQFYKDYFFDLCVKVGDEELNRKYTNNTNNDMYLNK